MKAKTENGKPYIKGQMSQVEEEQYIKGLVSQSDELFALAGCERIPASEGSKWQWRLRKEKHAVNKATGKPSND